MHKHICIVHEDRLVKNCYHSDHMQLGIVKFGIVQLGVVQLGIAQLGIV